MAILSLVFGVLSLVCSVIPYVGLVAILFTIPSIVLGIIALIKAIKNHTAGKGFAIAGLVCSAITSSFCLLFQFAAINFMKYRRESQAAACISNMKQIQAAAEQWLMNHSGTPTMSDLCGNDGYMKDEPKCPKDGSPYRLRGNDNNGSIEVECRSGDPTHVMSDYRW